MISFRLNGQPQQVDVPGDTPVLWCCGTRSA